MPRAFTQSGKDKIRLRLLQRGREYFIKYGLKKTSIEDLTRTVGIAKGSFYKFFDSKEALFLAIHEESEWKIREDVLRKLETIKDPIEKLRSFFKSSFLILEDDPLLRMVFNKEEFENLTSFLSSEQYEEHYRQDILFMENLFKQWQGDGVIRHLDVATISNLIVSTYYIVLQKEALGEEMYAKVTDMLSECLANYLAETTIDGN